MSSKENERKDENQSETSKETLKETPKDPTPQENESQILAQEMTTLSNFIDEAKKRLEWKNDLRKNNVNPQNRPEESDFHRLDSSLKKNTAFIRKLKNYTDSQKDSISKDLKNLNLTKYIAEVTSGIVEAKLKMTDLQGMIEICSKLHQLYVEFVLNIMEAWTKALTINKKEGAMSINLSKLRVDLRFFAELISVGVISLKEGLPLLGSVLTNVINIDKENHTNISIILTFCKYCGDEYAGLLPRKIRILAEKHRYEVPSDSLIPSEKQKNVRGILREYFNSVVKHLQRDYSEYQNLERVNRRILMSKGEVHAERLEKAEAAGVALAKLTSSVDQLAELLDEEVPALENPEDKKNEFNEEGVESGESCVTDIESINNLAKSLWEDDDIKNFYEDLADLKARIPAILYKDSSNVAVPVVEDVIDDDLEEDLDESAIIIDNNDDIDELPPSEIVDQDDTEESEASMLQPTTGGSGGYMTNKMIMDAFLSRLPTCVSRDMIDNAAADFCMELNTKKNRLKLVKSLFNVHRNRQDLLPFYGRFVATLFPLMPDISVDLGAYLKQEFRWQLRKKDQMKIESKLKIVRFMGELVKFKMFPKSEALFCMKQLLFDFSHHHIEMACTLMETCGRYLLRTPESHQRTKIYLEQMMRKKTASFSAESRYSMMIENAYYTACPPDTTSVAPKIKLPDWQAYAEKLILDELNKKNTEKVLKKIRKFDWNEKDVSNFMINLLGSVWRIKYLNIRYLTSLIAGLVSYHDWIGPRIVDAALEDIRVGMEINLPKYNQRRIAITKFLSELYNYRLVDSVLIFEILYSFITFGDESLDPPDHMLRIRLVCIILDTCGVYFTTGSSGKKLDYFLIYFQRYVWRKKICFPENAFPFAINNLLHETLIALRPKIIFFKSLQEVDDKVNKIEKEFLNTIQQKHPELFNAEEATETTNKIPNRDLIPIGEEDEEDAEDDIEHEDHFVRSQTVDDDEEEDEEDDYDLEDDSQLVDMSQEDIDEDDVVNDDDDEEEEEDYEDEDEEIEDEDDEEEEEDTAQIDDEDEEDENFPSNNLEEEEFIEMFDKMMNEQFSESRRPPQQSLDLQIPSFYKQKHKQQSYDSVNSNGNNDDNCVQFAVLMRKPQGGNKQIYKEIAVPMDSDLVQNLVRQEEAARLEKENVKRLTLKINERQEEEEVNEAIASMQRPGLVSTHRIDSRKRFQPPKGVPDADLIFGSKR